MQPHLSLMSLPPEMSGWFSRINLYDRTPKGDKKVKKNFRTWLLSDEYVKFICLWVISILS